MRSQKVHVLTDFIIKDAVLLDGQAKTIKIHTILKVNISISYERILEFWLSFSFKHKMTGKFELNT